ncbi:MAG TPA: hypothetical protein PLO89_11650, partial [Spirochaetota bacterium]|nr:hypothetical protein [Spirochaetota bacterium]
IKIKERCKFDLEMGIKLYYDKKFKEASILFKNIVDENNLDKTAALYFQRSVFYGEIGVEPDWNGVDCVNYF